jgi:protein-disulfide isomerase
MSNRLELVATLALATAAVAASTAFLYRTFAAPAVAQSPTALSETLITGWSEIVDVGNQVSEASSAPVTVVVFADFQCPACRHFHQNVIRKAIEKYPDALRVLYLHFPLEYHPHAMPASFATECFKSSGALSAWYDALFSKQDSLGSKSFTAFAADLKLADTASFSNCVSRADTSRVVRRGLELGKRIGITGTPAVGINGRLLSRPPVLRELDSLVMQVTHPSRNL